MKKLLPFFLLLAAISGFGQDKVVKEKNAQNRNITGFHAIHVSHGIDLVLTPGAEKVVIAADDADVVQKISTEVKDGVLKIYIDRDKMPWNWHFKGRMVAYVSYKQLDELSGSGGSDIKVEGSIKSEKLSIDVSGGGDFDGKVEVKNLSVGLSGGGDVTISGTAGTLSIDASGGGDFKGIDLVSDNCEIDASGGSDINVTVNKMLSVESSGGSDVHYRGNAMIKEKHMSGGGSVTKRD